MLFAYVRLLPQQYNSSFIVIAQVWSFPADTTFQPSALLTLVGRGIGPDTAARILRRYSSSQIEKSEEVLIKFLRDILKAELNYARTRGFWDNN